MATNEKSRSRIVFAGVLFLLSAFVSLSAFAQMTPEQMYNKGFEYYNGGEYEKGLECLLKSAEQGYAMAQFEVGGLYFNGRERENGVKQDYTETVKWFLKVIEQENKENKWLVPLTYTYLIDCYERDLGVEKNEKETIRMCTILANGEPVTLVPQWYYNIIVKEYNSGKSLNEAMEIADKKAELESGIFDLEHTK